MNISQKNVSQYPIDRLGENRRQLTGPSSRRRKGHRRRGRRWQPAEVLPSAKEEEVAQAPTSPDPRDVAWGPWGTVIHGPKTPRLGFEGWKWGGGRLSAGNSPPLPARSVHGCPRGPGSNRSGTGKISIFASFPYSIQISFFHSTVNRSFHILAVFLDVFIFILCLF